MLIIDRLSVVFVFVFFVFNVRLLPFFRADVLGVLNFGEDILIETEILDGVSANIDFLDAMKNLTILSNGTGT